MNSAIKTYEETVAERSDGTKEVQIYLERVHCADCVRDLIEGVILRIAGVTSAHFRDSDLCVVITTAPWVDEAALHEAILAVGYSFRDPGSKPVRTSNLTNGLYVGTAVAVLAVLIGFLQRI